MKPLISLVLFTLLAGASLQALSQDKNNMPVNTNKSTKASIDSITDYERFKMNAEMDIISNNRKIAGFITGDSVLNNNSSKTHNRSAIESMQSKNDTLAMEINAAASIQTDKWSAFKIVFQKKMYELMNTIDNY